MNPVKKLLKAAVSIKIWYKTVTNKRSSEKSCKNQFEALVEGQSRSFDAAMQHIRVKNHKNAGALALRVDEKLALRFIWVCKCGEKN